MYKRDKRKNAVIIKSIFLITTLSLCFSLLFFSNIIDMTDIDLIGAEIEGEDYYGQPVASQEDKNLKISKLESGVADSNIHNRTEQATERVEVSRSAPSRSQKNTPNATQPVTAQSEVKSKAPVATQPETKTKAPAAPQPKVKAKAPVATQPESKAKAPAAPQNMSGAKESYSAEDLDLLARLIHAEAQGEPYQAKVAVGAVVLNRIGPFSDSIRNVIYQNIDGYYQFTPVENGWINKPAGADSIKATKETLSGVDPTNGALFYYDNQTTNEWILAKPVSVRFGNMIFAY
jgi:spore germination cell wall hydrolase CwlJ-like protein